MQKQGAEAEAAAEECGSQRKVKAGVRQGVLFETAGTALHPATKLPPAHSRLSRKAGFDALVGAKTRSAAS